MKEGREWSSEGEREGGRRCGRGNSGVREKERGGERNGRELTDPNYDLTRLV